MNIHFISFERLQQIFHDKLMLPSLSNTLNVSTLLIIFKNLIVLNPPHQSYSEKINFEKNKID